jgi:hypothetical protein
VLDRDGHIRHSNVALSEGAANPAKWSALHKSLGRKLVGHGP